MKCHMASFIPHPEAFVHNFLQVIDIILKIGQNKNILANMAGTVARSVFFFYSWVLFHSITDTPDGLDIFSAIAQFFSQSDDLHIHAAVGHWIIIAVNGIHDHAAGKHPAGSPGEKIKDLKFGKG